MQKYINKYIQDIYLIMPFSMTNLLFMHLFL